MFADISTTTWSASGLQSLTRVSNSSGQILPPGVSPEPRITPEMASEARRKSKVIGSEGGVSPPSSARCT